MVPTSDFRARCRRPTRDRARKVAHAPPAQLGASSRRVERWAVPRPSPHFQRRICGGDVDLVDESSTRVGSGDHARLVRPLVHSPLHRTLQQIRKSARAKEAEAARTNRRDGSRTIPRQQPGGARSGSSRQELRCQPHQIQKPIYSGGSFHTGNRIRDTVAAPAQTPTPSRTGQRVAGLPLEARFHSPNRTVRVSRSLPVRTASDPYSSGRRARNQRRPEDVSRSDASRSATTIASSAARDSTMISP